MSIDEIVKRIEQTPTPPVNKVAVAYSGGLDSSLGIELLRRKYKAKEIFPVTIDVGQGEDEVAAIGAELRDLAALKRAHLGR